MNKTAFSEWRSRSLSPVLFYARISAGIAMVAGEPMEVSPDLERIPQELCLELQDRLNAAVAEAEAAIQ